MTFFFLFKALDRVQKELNFHLVETNQEGSCASLYGQHIANVHLGLLVKAVVFIF
jgi:hypothetical protein